MVGECSSCINMGFITSEKSKPLVDYEGFKIKFSQIGKTFFSDGHAVVNTVTVSYIQTNNLLLLDVLLGFQKEKQPQKRII